MNEYILISDSRRSSDPPLNKFKEQFEEYWQSLSPAIRELFHDRTVAVDERDQAKDDTDK